MRTGKMIGGICYEAHPPLGEMRSFRTAIKGPIVCGPRSRHDSPLRLSIPAGCPPTLRDTAVR